jgi:hypothetical protein
VATQAQEKDLIIDRAAMNTRLKNFFLVPLVGVLILPASSWAESPVVQQQPIEAGKSRKSTQEPASEPPGNSKPAIKKIDSKKNTTPTGLCDGS